MAGLGWQEEVQRAGAYPDFADLRAIDGSASLVRRAKQIEQGYKDRIRRKSGLAGYGLSDPLEALAATSPSGHGEFERAVRAVLECAGIHDVLSKSLGSSNQINIVHATVAALQGLEEPEAVASRRGLPVEDVAPAALLKARAEVTS